MSERTRSTTDPNRAVIAARLALLEAAGVECLADWPAFDEQALCSAVFMLDAAADELRSWGLAESDVDRTGAIGVLADALAAQVLFDAVGV